MQGIRAVNGVSAKANVAKKILPPLLNRDGHIDAVRVLAKGVARLIDSRVEKTLRNVKTMHQVRAFLDVGGDKRKMLLQF